MRKLARVVEINSLEPILNADLIEVAVVGGWKVVVKKGEYQPGDLAIYIEIDAFLPEGNPLWQFLVDKSSRIYEEVKGHVLRSIKLRGVVSQGLLLPLINDYAAYTLGDDLTTVLGISKYEPPIPAQLAGTAKGFFPRAIPKTDQERIQNLADQWADITSKSYEVTEKLEGSSMTVYLLAGEFGVCSRNLDLKQDENNTLWKVAIEEDLATKMQLAFHDHIALQGELIGEGVQGNIYGIKGHKFLVYDIYDIASGQYLNPESRRLICEKFSIDHVPVEQESMDLLPETSMATLVDIANGKSQLNPKVKREGLVFKSLNLTGERTSFKVISNDYLLGEKRK